MNRRRFLERAATEARHPRSGNLDQLDADAFVSLFLRREGEVLRRLAASKKEIARLVRRAGDALCGGGRIFYAGAGTSGRLAVLDAAECPPTFGTKPDRVQGVIAGGRKALVKSVEGAEDDAAAGAREMRFRRVGPKDFVIGVSASGTAPFVLAALREAKKHKAKTALVAFNKLPRIKYVDGLVTPVVGPEILSGSTRLGAGTATKIILNMISTGAMIRLGKVYGNLMVDVRATNEKLRHRVECIVMAASGVPREKALRCLAASGGRVKTAIVMAKRGISMKEAEARIRKAKGILRSAI